MSKNSLYSFQISSSFGAAPGSGTTAVVAAAKLSIPVLLEAETSYPILGGKVRNSSGLVLGSNVSPSLTGALAGFAESWLLHGF